MNKKFENLCQMTQKGIKKHLSKELSKAYDNIIEGDGYLFAKGDVPILLVAHMDTVHLQAPSVFVYSKNGDVVSSPQGIGGDDRCGIYMILEIIKHYKCSVLFAEDEEKGCIGSKKFVKESFVKNLEFNYIIELDRMGSKDAVFYECDNPEFEDFITADKDWETAFGTFTDICTLAPVLGCAAVNFSCGYYKAHTTSEYVVLSEMENNIEKVCRLIERTTEADKFEYIEAVYNGFYGCGYYTKPYVDDNDDENDFMWGLYAIEYINKDGNVDWEEIYARSEWEAIGMFLEDHPTMTYADIDVDFYGYDEYYM